METEENDKISLREYVDVRFTAQEDAVKNALAAAKEAVTKAETASDKRFESVNEFRNTLKDQQSTLVTRELFDSSVAGIEARIDILQTFMNRNQGKSDGLSKGWAVLIGAVGFIATIISLFTLFSR